MNCANHPDRERKAFCQNCGKPLCNECARTVGQAVFCEPCLELRLAAANSVSADIPPFASGSGTPFGGYQSVPGGSTGYAYPGAAEASSYTVSGVPPAAGSPNPGIAFLLGLIPGVGAMYNGQYSKGVVHLVIFAVLVSLSGQNGIFGIFVAAWIFYQSFEAYHTARARRDGTTLPNPFGFNDIGDRFGFGKSWPSQPGSGPFSPGVPPAAAAAAEASSSVPPPPADTAYSPWGTPRPPAGYTVPPRAYPPNAAEPRSGDPAVGSWGAPADVYTAPLPASASRFPFGAVILIGLGVLFLLGNTRLFFSLPMHFLLPALLIGVGVYVFVRRMTASGIGFVDDGTSAYRLRLVRALQSSVWIVLVGILFLLDQLRILTWAHSWPLFIIVGGVMAFVQRSAYFAAAQQYPYPPYNPPAAAPGPVAPSASTSDSAIIRRDEEGS